MPAATPQEITDAILDSIADSGGIGLLVPGESANPRKILVSLGDSGLSLWAYAWSLTFGGRPTLPNEYRIQMTSVDSPLPLNPDGLTVLVGYEPDLRMFAGFDLGRHASFTPGSPSVQIDLPVVQRALQDGLAFNRKANNELAIGIRPDNFLFYCQRAAELHDAGADVVGLDLLERASALDEVPPAALLPLPQERRRVVQEVSRLARSANFRLQVLQAYGDRCAVTRAQLRIIEAAHILPVSAGDESIDVVQNGIALSPTYHRAFDRGLIYLDEDLVMRLNSPHAAVLRDLSRDGGLDSFAAPLGRIHLPPDRHQRPDRYFIRSANEHRNIPA